MAAILSGPCPISLADAAVIRTLPMPIVWAWWQGAKRRHHDEMRYRADLLASILRVAGITIDPAEIYPQISQNTSKIEEKLVEITKTWQKK